jgi:hypothetical protein
VQNSHSTRKLKSFMDKFTKKVKEMKNLLLLAFLSSCVAAPAMAQQQCVSTPSIVEKTLREKYQEAPNGLGLVANGQLTTLYVAPTGTWTIVITLPNGMTCLVMSGTNWEFVKPPPQGEEG